MGNELSNTPQVACRWCLKLFSGGVTRIKEHFIGGVGACITICPCESNEFCKFKDKLMSLPEVKSASMKREKQLLEKEVDRNVSRTHRVRIKVSHCLTREHQYLLGSSSARKGM